MNSKAILSKNLSKVEKDEILQTLQFRFEKNKKRHPDLEWNGLNKILESNPEKLWSLSEMERTGGEPDLMAYDHPSGEYIFFDFSMESPKGRRSLCYDLLAHQSRKENKPIHNAVDLAQEMGIEILTEDQYMKLQQFGTFDTKTSSWLNTPTHIRILGGAIFADYRFGRVFVYHNGAESYYAGRGFRGSLRI